MFYTMGQELGLAFQIQDDLYDKSGQFTTLGKLVALMISQRSFAVSIGQRRCRANISFKTIDRQDSLSFRLIRFFTSKVNIW